MVAVNLIPDKLILSQQRRKRMRYWFLVVGLVFCTISTLGILEYHSLCNADNSSRGITQKSRQLQEKFKELNQQKQQLDLWRDRFAVLTELDRYHNFVNIIGYLTRHSPELIYLKQMEITQISSETGSAQDRAPLAKGAKMFLINKSQVSSAPVLKTDAQDGSSQADRSASSGRMVMMVKGMALDYGAVADFLNVLRNSGFFRYVYLQRSGRNLGLTRNPEKNSRDSLVVEFEIECPLMPALSSARIDYADMQEPKNL
ncbi:MAG: PilN domain-containing protein [Sedimentisphaerales bacterium]|nr:PilN domain-containing protein [Sedimentisphaerales bacterium]